jgi:predicted nucleic acid-binding protein
LKTALVVDCSTVLAWAFDDELSEKADRAMMLAAERGMVAPPIWWYEVRNTLVVAERRRRLDATRARAVLEALEELHPVFDFDHADDAIISLANVHGLTIYDAAYLEVAQRRGLPLATLDKRLLRAAKTVRVEVVTT